MGFLYSLSTIVLTGWLQGCGKPTIDSQDLQPLLGKWKTFDHKLQSIQDPIQRDLLLLQLVVISPRHAPALCRRTNGQNAKEKCRQVVGRPHLGIVR